MLVPISSEEPLLLIVVIGGVFMLVGIRVVSEAPCFPLVVVVFVIPVAGLGATATLEV